MNNIQILIAAGRTQMDLKVRTHRPVSKVCTLPWMNLLPAPGVETPRPNFMHLSEARSQCHQDFQRLQEMACGRDWFWRYAQSPRHSEVKSQMQCLDYE